MINQIHIAVISHNRPNNVEKTESLTGLDNNLNWYVGKGEKKAYKHAKGQVVEGGNLVESRNLALEIAEAAKKYCFMIDDDLTYINYILTNKSTTRITFKLLLREMFDVLSSVPMYVAGVSPTGNPFWYDSKKPMGMKHFIVASCMMVKHGCPLRFDPQFKLKEDYDYTLQHIKKYGGVCRINYLAPKFQHYSNKGGVVDTRNDQLEQQSINRLIKKWGPTVRRNPKRENEVLLYVK